MKSSHFYTPDHQETLFLSLFWQKQIKIFLIFFNQNHGLAQEPMVSPFRKFRFLAL